jgi:hypothetical protein
LADNLFVADSGNNTVREIFSNGGAYGSYISVGSDFSAPTGVAVEAGGNVFVADYGNSAVKETSFTIMATGSDGV